MRNLTEEQLLSLTFTVTECTSEADEFSHQYIDEYMHDHEVESEPRLCFDSWHAGYVTLTSECGISLKLTWSASGGSRTYKEALDFDIEIERDNDTEINGAVLVDQDGDELDYMDSSCICTNAVCLTDWESHVHAILPKAEIEEFDLDEDAEMGTHVVERDDDRAIKFTGEVIGWASSDQQMTRWIELTLYKTKGDSYICEKIRHSIMASEEKQCSGAIFETLAEAIDYIGMSQTAKELYKDAGINTVSDVA